MFVLARLKVSLTCKLSIGWRKNSPRTSRKRSYFFVYSREQIRLVENGLKACLPRAKNIGIVLIGSERRFGTLVPKAQCWFPLGGLHAPYPILQNVPPIFSTQYIFQGKTTGEGGKTQKLFK